MAPSPSPIPGLTPERAAQLLQALELTRGLLEAARAGDWERAAHLQARRESLLQSFFATPPPREAEAAVAARLQEMAALNDEAAALISQARDALGAELQTLNRGRRAARAYHRTE